jgi:hypothetical protein
MDVAFCCHPIACLASFMHVTSAQASLCRRRDAGIVGSLVMWPHLPQAAAAQVANGRFEVAFRTHSDVASAIPLLHRHVVFMRPIGPDEDA